MAKKKNANVAAQLEAALAALEAANVKIEALSAPKPTTIQAGPLAHGEAAAGGFAEGAIGARGHRKVAKPMKIGGSAHRNFAQALRGAKILVGDSIQGQKDVERIHAAAPLKQITGLPCQTLAGVRSNWLDKAADADLLERIGSGKGTKGEGYIVLPAMFEGLDGDTFEIEPLDGFSVIPEAPALDPEIEAVVNPAWLIEA